MNIRNAALRLVFCLIEGIGFCQAQTDQEQIDQVLNNTCPPDHPGVVALISQGEDIVFHEAYGLANVELEVPMEVDRKFCIASITKQFTAMAILMLMEEGRLSLDDCITKHVEDYPTHGHTITIHHLLTHTSGIKNYTKIEGTGQFALKPFESIDFIRFFSKAPMDFAPGQQRSYSNSGYYILGYIIEKLSGQSYGEFMAEKIFEPLGMTGSRFSSNEDIIKGRASGHVLRNGRVTNAAKFNVQIPFSAGSLISTARDLHLWNTAIHQAKVVKEDTLQLAFENYKTDRDQATNYGYGFRLGNIHDRATIEHDGGIPGYGSYAVYFPGEDVFAVILSNCSNCVDLGSLMSRVTNIALFNR